MKKRIIIITLAVVLLAAIATVVILVFLPKYKLEKAYQENINKANNLDFSSIIFFEKNTDYKDSSKYLDELKTLQTVRGALDICDNIEMSSSYDEYNEIIETLNQIEEGKIQDIALLTSAKKQLLKRLTKTKETISKSYINVNCVGLYISLTHLASLSSSLGNAYTEILYWPYYKPSLSDLRLMTMLSLNNGYCKAIKKKKKNTYNCVYEEYKNDMKKVDGLLKSTTTAVTDAKLYGVSEQYINKLSSALKFAKDLKKINTTYNSDVMTAQLYRQNIILTAELDTGLRISFDTSYNQLLSKIDDYLNKCEPY